MDLERICFTVFIIACVCLIPVCMYIYALMLRDESRKEIELQKDMTERFIKMGELGYDQTSNLGLSDPVWQKLEGK